MTIRTTKGHLKKRQQFFDLVKTQEFKQKVQKIFQMSSNRRRSATMKLAEEYQLNIDMFSPLMSILMKRKVIEADLLELDMCIINDDFDEDYNESFPVLNPKDDRSRKIRESNYPISIAISPYASLRDVLSFISIKWSEIRGNLDDYDEFKRYRTRTKRKRDEFIWTNQHIPRKELQNSIETLYPDDMLTKDDINRIIRTENRRRRKIS